jgi:branched-subunit amino acid transport protein
MERLALILAIGLATYAIRITGFALPATAIPPSIDRFLRYVPIAAFAALITPGIGAGTDDLLARLAGAALASIAVLRFRALWIGLTIGMAVYWATRLIKGAL